MSLSFCWPVSRLAQNNILNILRWLFGSWKWISGDPSCNNRVWWTRSRDQGYFLPCLKITDCILSNDSHPELVLQNIIEQVKTGFVGLVCLFLASHEAMVLICIWFNPSLNLKLQHSQPLEMSWRFVGAVLTERRKKLLSPHVKIYFCF